MPVLYRAASDGYVGTGYSFALELEDARAYLDNPGFGGYEIYRADVEVSVEDVVDLREWSEERLERLDGWMRGMDVCEQIPRSVRVADALRALGYLWAIVADSYPEGCETWQWLGGCADMDREPELEPV